MTITTQTWYTFDLTHGVLVVTLQAPTLTSDAMLDDFRHTVIEHLEAAATAVLIDCQQVTGRTSTQLFTTLVSVRHAAQRQGIFLCVCGLTNSLQEAYDVCQLGRIIPAYADRELALEAVGNYSTGELRQRKVERAHALIHDPSAVIEVPSDPPTKFQRWKARWQASRFHSSSSLIIALIWSAVALGMAWVAVSFAIVPLVNASRTTAAPYHISGQVILNDGANRFGDAHALVLAWRCDAQCDNKISAAALKQAYSDDDRHAFRYSGMYAARTTGHGLFDLPLEQPGEYYILIVSSSRQNTAGLSETDAEVLGDVLDAPADLLGHDAYRIRHEAVATRGSRIVETFALAAKQ